MKKTKIIYHPSKTDIDITTFDAVENTWKNLSPDSKLLYYTNIKVLFSNCVEDIVKQIDDVQNSNSDGLEIQFIGPKDDYNLLQEVVEKVLSEKNDNKPLTCKYLFKYYSADEALSRIKKDYKKISEEFEDYLPGQKKYVGTGKSIGDTIEEYKEVTRNEVPICIIGNYSVGKSAFINALLGDEILPSKVNASTAKNTKIIESSDYSVTLTYNEEDKSYDVTLSFDDGKISVIDSDVNDNDISYKICSDIIDKLKEIYGKDISEVSAKKLLHDTLDFLNESEGHSLLEKIGWNLVVKAPFANSVLSESDSEIILYDTPGSNNATLNQQAHREALEQMMSEQTNALPVFVATRDSISSNDNYKIKNLLDDYSDNFSNPNCIIVLSKSDKLTKSELDQDLPPEIIKWHGKSTVLFVTPVGAIGERKVDKDNWIDESYKDAFYEWQKKMQDEKSRIDLVKHNIIPCNRNDMDKVKESCSQELFDTGIPSLENEILFYIQNYANYKKCIRGQRSLLSALESVDSELENQKKATSKEKELAESKRRKKKAEIIEELEAIKVDDYHPLIAKLIKHNEEHLNDYCKEMHDVLSDIYDEVVSDDVSKMDDIFGKKFREHCQEHLLNKCYIGKDGIQEEIQAELFKYANKYSRDLRDFLTNNKSNLSDEESCVIEKFLNDDVEPKFKQVKSILGKINELIEKASLVKYLALINVKKDEKMAKEYWIESKQSYYIKKLRDSNNLLGKNKLGLFNKNAIANPVKEYYEQLLEWTGKYREFIKGQLDQDNAILSGMEEDIKLHEDTIIDLENRVSRLEEVKVELINLLEIVKLDK